MRLDGELVRLQGSRWSGIAGGCHMSEKAADTGLMGLGRDLLELVAVLRRHIANTAVTTDRAVTTRNLSQLDAVEQRVRTRLDEVERTHEPDKRASR